MAAMAKPVQAVDLALGALAGYERPDLEARLRQAKNRLLADHVRVLVVGEFKKGKSMLVNGLVGAPVCPVLDDLSTAVPTVVKHADAPSVTLVRVLDTGDIQRIPVPIEDIARYASESGNPGNRERLSQVEIGMPRAVLAGGLVLVDTPGVGGLSSVHAAATMATLPAADAVLLVSDASQEYTAPEIEFLRQAISVCPNVACVLTKTDLYPDWRTIADLDRGHLARAGIEARLFTVSSTMRWQALLTENEELRAELSAESGYPPLVRYLRQDVVAKADELARRSTVHDVLGVTEQVAGALRTEESTQENPERVQEVISRLTAAEQRAAGLKERSARWQQTLNDGVADLNADIDYDLRDRLREIVRDAEEAIVNGGDPTRTWDQFQSWVEQSATSAASANYVWATQRARWLAQRVAEHFDEERAHLLPALRIEPSDALRSVRTMTVRESETLGVGKRLLTGVKGGYMGVLMFGMLGTLVGFTLLNPISIGAGLLMGRKSIGDERRRIITKRQNDAKAGLRRYIDDVTFHVSKDSRDMLRGVQRVLRDHFTALAEQMKRSLQDSLRAAEKSVKTTQAERDARLAEIRAELARLDQVAQQVRTLLPVERVAA
ncbi:MAG: Isoniazid-inducible protein iniA [Actinophytocola sp.]|uniref:dynamin family protein n=1 Tax=Actinophytocola sp. TaxID=1872138 RepID=UPI0013272762|nr:dynamin family protein [Actinophytocola sp.]MPZ82525.1 Isoniazid-inducible protein iniA [Actinophytocola sp.]